MRTVLSTLAASVLFFPIPSSPAAVWVVDPGGDR